jgi:hypothetical protein
VVGLVLLAFAFVFACLAAGPVVRLDPYRMHLGWAAIALWIASEIFGRAGFVH